MRTLTDLPKKGDFDKETAQRLIHGYYAATSYLDHNVGKLIQALKEHGLYENTIIIFASDHGYHLGENSHWTKATVRELDVQVPLLVRVPGSLGTVSDAMVEYVDIYPTLAELVDIASPDGGDGKSFKHVLNHSNQEHRLTALSQAARPWPSNKPVKKMGYSIRYDRYRYTRWVDVKTRKIIAEEVYLIEEDLLQRNNIIEQIDKEILNKLRKLLSNKLN